MSSVFPMTTTPDGDRARRPDKESELHASPMRTNRGTAAYTTTNTSTRGVRTSRGTSRENRDNAKAETARSCPACGGKILKNRPPKETAVGSSCFWLLAPGESLDDANNCWPNSGWKIRMAAPGRTLRKA